MHVLISLEIVICFNLKYAIDFEKVINTANKKKLGGFPWLAVNGFPVQRQCKSSPTSSLILERMSGWPADPGHIQPCSGAAEMTGPRSRCLGTRAKQPRIEQLLHVSAAETHRTALKKEVTGEQVTGAWPLLCSPGKQFQVLPETLPARTRMTSSQTCLPSSMGHGGVSIGKLSREPNRNK